MDPDDTHLRKAAHCMVRNLTSGLAMITCREQVIQTLTTNLKQHFMSVIIVCIYFQVLKLLNWFYKCLIFVFSRHHNNKKK